MQQDPSFSCERSTAAVHVAAPHAGRVYAYLLMPDTANKTLLM